MKGFIEFVKSQGVVGLAVGFILGAEVAKVVDAIVNDLINPLLGILLGSTGNLSEASLQIGKAHIMWGHFITIMINFLIVALVVYIVVTKLRLDKHLDKKS
jgi:large conductance mechanosensitive channel